jgi:hypothetical protein
VRWNYLILLISTCFEYQVSKIDLSFLAISFSLASLCLKLKSVTIVIYKNTLGKGIVHFQRTFKIRFFYKIEADPKV